MTSALVTIRGKEQRDRIARWAAQAPYGTRVTFKETKRSIPQNDRMWAMLTDVARQVEWHGQKLTPDDWKLLFLDALKREGRVVPSLEGDGVVNLGRSSSNLSKQEMSDMMELIAAFGANHGVKFGDDDAEEPAPAQ